jgi:hypothetical protein
MRQGALSEERKRRFVAAGLAMSRAEWYWEKMLERYLDFLLEQGRYPVKMKGRSREEQSLADWRMRQRRRIRDGSLTGERKERFIGHGLDASFTMATWLRHLGDLKKFIRENGRYPRNKATDFRELTLSAWLIRNRRRMAAGKLSGTQTALLKSLSITGPEAKDGRWMKSYRRLKELIDTQGRFPSSKVYGEERWSYNWFMAQRRLLDDGLLDDERRRRIEELLPCFMRRDEGRGRKWMANFRRLDRYILSEKCIPPTESGTPRDRKLGKWIRYQVHKWRNGILEPDKRQLLRNLGVELTSEGRCIIATGDESEKKKRKRKKRAIAERTEKIWWRRCAELADWITTNKKLPVARKADGKKGRLSIWIGNQRSKYRKDMLSPDKSARLEELGVLACILDPRPRSRDRQTGRFV